MAPRIPPISTMIFPSTLGIELLLAAGVCNFAGPRLVPKIAMSSPGATGPLRRLAAFTIPPGAITGFCTGGEDGMAWGYGPRRTTLDKILVDAAVNNGAEPRENFTVDDYVFGDGKVVGIRRRGPNG